MHKQPNGRRDWSPRRARVFGGLDTSPSFPWLRETYGARVVCYSGRLGQGLGELDGLIRKAKRPVPKDCIIEDLREEFVQGRRFPHPAARPAVYARTYLLGTSMARPITAAHQVRPWRSGSARTPSRTAAPAKATTKSGSS